MSDGPRYILSRRAALASLAAAAAYGSAITGSIAASAAADNGAGPVFSPSGPNAELYGAAENYPIKDPALAFTPGNPLTPKYRVGAFSHFDQLYPTRQIKRASSPWQFTRAQADMPGAFRGRVTDYLSRNPVTGLLIAKDDRILFEHYQYGRTDRDLLISQSMVKLDAEGFEVAHGAFNAVLRDYARLGRLLAHDGAWDGRQIIPAQWMIDATTVRAADAYLAPRKLGVGSLGYGYLIWLLPGTRRQFTLTGLYGQHVLVDPASKLVMVQTAVEKSMEVWRLWSALVEQFGQE